jgi:predicted LPLAT superfamily acyltransferase
MNNSQNQEESHWSQIREKGSSLGLAVMFFFFRIPGRAFFSVTLYPVMLYFFITNRLARHASMQFLKQVYQYDPVNSPWKKEPGLTQSFANFLSFGQAIADKLAAWTNKLNLEEVQYMNKELFDQVRNSSRGVVFVGSHLGNIEVSRALATRYQNKRINVLLHTKHAENFNRLMAKLNPDSNLRLIQVSEVTPATAIALNEKIENGEIIIIVGDRTSITQPDRVIYSPFLGKEAPFPPGPFVLAGLLRCPVYSLFCFKEGKRYQIHLELLSERIHLSRRIRQQQLQEAVDSYAQKLTHFSVLYPLQWYNFFPFWGSHQRSETNTAKQINKAL